MISKEDNWEQLVEKIIDRLNEWKLLDKSRVTYTSTIEDGYEKNDHIRYIPLISKLNDGQLKELKTLKEDSDWAGKSPKLEERFNEEGIWLMVF